MVCQPDKHDLFKRCLEQAVHEMAWELAKEMIPDDCR